MKTPLEDITTPPIGIDSFQVIVAKKDVKVTAHILRVWIHRHIKDSASVTVTKYDDDNLAVDCPTNKLAAQVSVLVEIIKTKGTPGS